MSHSPHHQSDKKAAFTGLIVTVALLFVMAYGVVLWTNAQFAGHAKDGAKTEATH